MNESAYFDHDPSRVTFRAEQEERKQREQEQSAEKAFALLNSKYSPANKREIERDESAGAVVLHLNRKEAEVLYRVIHDKLHAAQNDFAEEAHEQEPDAYTLGLIDYRQQFFEKLARKVGEGLTEGSQDVDAARRYLIHLLV